MSKRYDMEPMDTHDWRAETGPPCVSNEKPDPAVRDRVRDRKAGQENRRRHVFDALEGRSRELLLARLIADPQARRATREEVVVRVSSPPLSLLV